MIITARQLEDLHRQNGANGHVTLPYRARLTPLAVDYIKQRKLVLGYSSVTAEKVVSAESTPAQNQPLAASRIGAAATPTPSTGSLLYWCDGPCGPAKAAVVSAEKESNLCALAHPADPGQLIPVIKQIAIQVKSSRASGGILLVQHGAAAVVFANRCPSLRAALGTSLDAVEQAIQQAAANVLIIEYPTKTLQQVKNLLARFVKGNKQASENVNRQIQELTSCG